jgi:hypothetical protein
MILLTSDLRERLLANGRKRNVDHVPVVKFFNPLGAGTWLATELGKDGDQLFGLADLGFPELGVREKHPRLSVLCSARQIWSKTNSERERVHRRRPSARA